MKSKIKEFIKDEIKKLKKIRRRKSEAYTFVETLSVLAITTILMSGTAYSASKGILLAKKAAARNQIAQFCAGLQSYFLDCGKFPTTEQGLKALWEKPVFYPVPEDWDGPYLERKPSTKDPWSGDFVYLCAENSIMPSEVPENLPFVIICYGADGQQGGDGKNADINSWE